MVNSFLQILTSFHTVLLMDRIVFDPDLYCLAKYLIFCLGMRSLGDMLLGNESITELDLAWNICGPSGAAYLFRSVVSDSLYLLMA